MTVGATINTWPPAVKGTAGSVADAALQLSARAVRQTNMGSTRQSEPSARVVLQRIRNRIIEYLELVSSFADQRQYQSTVSIDVVTEIVNQWEDWVTDGWESSFAEPVFSDEERSQIARFGKTWSDVADRLPQSLPSLSEVQRTDDWLQLRESAEQALRVFERRGRLPEEEVEAGDVT